MVKSTIIINLTMLKALSSCCIKQEAMTNLEIIKVPMKAKLQKRTVRL